MREASSTLLFQEAAQSGAVVRALLERNRAVAERLATALRARPPRAVVTCARGSSDHAATYAKYLIETRAGVLVASAAPSISSVYGGTPDLDGCLFIAISQSGRSPDLLATASAARSAGATVVALVNDEASPLAAAAEHVFALCAGPERSVAASKSFIAALAATLQLVATWRDDAALRSGLDACPQQLAAAWALDWDAALPALAAARHLFVIGRGLGLGIAQELALKGKETCGLHAEAFSGAEVRHGPQALLDRDFPALLLVQDDEARDGLVALAGELVARGVDVLVAGARVEGATVLPTLSAHPAVQPLLLAQSGYRLIDALARARGRDPDRPPHLSKITETH
jgi:glucosamine--fructose-6-phosphate aminotransferase (isomerizing)